MSPKNMHLAIKQRNDAGWSFYSAMLTEANFSSGLQLMQEGLVHSLRWLLTSERASDINQHFAKYLVVVCTNATKTPQTQGRLWL